MLIRQQVASFSGYIRRALNLWDAHNPLPRLISGQDRIGSARFAVYGYFLSEIGLGEAARRIVDALDTAGDADLINIPLLRRQNEPALTSRVLRASPAARVTLTIAAVDTVAARGTTLNRDKVNIGYPYWELPNAPAHIIKGLNHYDQHWAPSGFIRDFLANCQSAPVHLVKQPVQIPDRDPDYHLGDGPFTFLSYFDVDSLVSRKNPQGVVEAFHRAFASTDRDVRLVVKVRGKRDGGIRRWLSDMAAKDPRITLIDRFLSRDEMQALLASANAFVSLHRSEGFGFGPAEALLAGKPVIATDFGGSTDFLTEATAFPVSWQARPVAPGEYPNSAGSFWAEPDIDHAAAQMRALCDDPASGVARARAGFALLRQNHAPAVIGRQIKALLQDIGA